MADSKNTVSYREIPGHPGYQVGDDGSVWSKWRRGHGGIGTSWHRLRPQRQNGNFTVMLGRDYQLIVSRIVLEAFVGPCPQGLVACHYPDRDPANNALSNLRWDTWLNNMADRDKHGTTVKGEKVWCSKLTSDEVLAIRAEHATGEVTLQHLAEKYGMSSKSVIHDIGRRKTWKHI